MAVAIVSTVGGASSNSFATLAEADSYMESRLNASSWETSASTDTKNRALVEATRHLSAMTWKGDRVDSTQALSWPRWNAPDPDNPNGWYYESTVVPQRIKDATCELAFQYVKAGTEDLAAADPAAGIQEKTIDVVTTRWFDAHSKPTGIKRFTRVMQLIQPLLAGSSAGQVTLVRG